MCVCVCVCVCVCIYLSSLLRGVLQCLETVESLFSTLAELSHYNNSSN